MFTRNALATIQRAYRQWKDPTDWREAYLQTRARVDELENTLFQMQTNIKLFLGSLNNKGAVNFASTSVANTWTAAQTFNTGTTTIGTADINGGFIDGVVLGGSSPVICYTSASGAGAASFRLPHGTAPSAPTNGDVWTTTAGMYVRINGGTVGPLA